mgnify:CR=1 FL=1
MRESIDVRGRKVARTRLARTATLWMLLLGALSLGSACARNSSEETAAEPVPVTQLRVENQAFLDMTIYVYRNSQRVRLGIATGNSTTKFVIPANLLFFGSSLVLLAVIMQLSYEAGRLEEETRTLAEELGILRFEVERLRDGPHA